MVFKFTLLEFLVALALLSSTISVLGWVSTCSIKKMLKNHSYKRLQREILLTELLVNSYDLDIEMEIVPLYLGSRLVRNVYFVPKGLEGFFKSAVFLPAIFLEEKRLFHPGLDLE